jgi:hypothetical protein
MDTFTEQEKQFLTVLKKQISGNSQETNIWPQNFVFKWIVKVEDQLSLEEFMRNSFKEHLLKLAHKHSKNLKYISLEFLCLIQKDEDIIYPYRYVNDHFWSWSL